MDQTNNQNTHVPTAGEKGSGGHVIKLVLVMLVVAACYHICRITGLGTTISPPTIIGEQARHVTSDKISVLQEPASITVRYWDKHDWEQPRGDPAAWTYWAFQCRPHFSVHPKASKKDPEKPNVYLFEVEKVSIELSLPMNIWLPYFPPPWLREHEDGHTLICKRVYDSSALVALECARKLINKEIAVTTSDHFDAEHLAEMEVQRLFAIDYRERSSDVANKINQIYDRLTDHGRKTGVKREEAIEAAFKEYASSEAASNAASKAAAKPPH